MSKYDVTFTETVVYTIRVDANDGDEACEKADEIATNILSKMNKVCIQWETYQRGECIEEVSSDD